MRTLVCQITLVLALGMLLTMSEVHAQEAPPLFVETQAEQPSEDSTVVRSRKGTLNLEHLTALVTSGAPQVSLNLFDDVSPLAVRDRVVQLTDTEYTWFGRLEERPEDHVILEITTEPFSVFGMVSVVGRNYEVRSAPDGGHVVREVITSPYPDEDQDFDGEEDSVDTGLEGPFFDLSREAVRFMPRTASVPLAKQAAEDPTIDVLILFTQDARQAAGDLANIWGEIRSAVSLTDLSFRESGVNARARLAGMAEVVPRDLGLSSGTNKSKKLRRRLKKELKQSGSDLHKLRAQMGADIVGLFVDGLKNSCGRAYIQKNPRHNFRKKAVFVVDRDPDCLQKYTATHEMGHVMGARHDWFADKHVIPYQYSHGFVNITDPNASDDAGWRTMMAYDDECNCLDEGLTCNAWIGGRNDNSPKCNRIPRWSTPDRDYQGAAMGVPDGVPPALVQPADNVRTLNETAPIVAGFTSQPPIVSGTITDVATGQPLEDVHVKSSGGPIDSTDSNGRYELAAQSGSTATITPRMDGYVFDPAHAQLSNVTSDRQQDFDARPLYTVSGRITFKRSGLSGVEIMGTGSTQPPVTDGSGNYQFELPHGFSGTLTPRTDKHDFTPADLSISSLSSDTTQSFDAGLKEFTVSGQVTEAGGGSPIEDVEMVLSNRGDVRTDVNGEYSFDVKYGESVTITPSQFGYIFSPRYSAPTNITRDLTRDFTARSATSSDLQWALFGADARHTSRVNVPGVRRSERWDRDLNAALSSPVVGEGGVVFVASDKDSIRAIDPSGDDVWTSDEVEGDIVGPPAAATAGWVFVATNILDSRALVYGFVTHRGTAYESINEEDSPVSAPPMVDGNRLYVGFGHVNRDERRYLGAFSVPDLFRQWSFETDGVVTTTPAVAPDGTIYVGTSGDSLFAVQPDGSRKWAVGTGGAVRSAPTVADDGTIYFGSDDDSLHAVRADGSRKWAFPTGGNVRSSPALDSNGNIYFGSTDGTFYAVDPSGSELWSHDLGAPIYSSPAVSYIEVDAGLSVKSDEFAYVGADDDSLHVFTIDAINPPTAAGTHRWAHEVSGGRVRSSPALGNAGLYITAGSGFDELAALDAFTKGEAQFSAVAHDPVIQNRDDLDLIAWASEQGGLLGTRGPADIFGRDGGLGDEPCEGGPLIIPNCPDAPASYGDASRFQQVVAGKELVIGLAESDNPRETASGETTEGLLGTAAIFIEPGETANLILAGVTDPSSFASNPNGRDTDLQVIKKSGLGEAADDTDVVHVYTAHASTDAGATRVTLRGKDDSQEHALGETRFGDASETKQVPRGEYEAVVEVEGSGAGKRSTTQQRTFNVDLSDRAGQPVGLVVAGFLHPAQNQNGPGLTLKGVTPEGTTISPVGRGGPIAVSIPTGIEGSTGAEDIIPVEVSDLTGRDMSSFRLDIEYDPELLEVTGVTSDGTLSEGIQMEVNTGEPGRILIAAADADALEGSGALLNLQVDYLTAGDFTLSFAEALLNEGDPPAEAIDGTGTIYDIIFGDVNRDSTVAPIDAAFVLQHAVDLLQLTGSALLAAEVSGSGTVTPYDASLILQYSVDLITCFPVEEGCEAVGKQAVAPGGRLAWEAPRRTPDADVVELPLVLTDADDVTSLIVEAPFDASAYAVETVTSALGREATLVHDVAGDTLRLALASAEALTGEIATVRLRRLQRGAPPTLEGTWRANEAPVQTLTAAETDVPAEYSLAPNYPNPFNPQTTIRYTLPEAAEVQLTVFDVLGRQVAVLVDGKKEAGRHAVRFDARELPSGVYFYRIEAGDFTETHEMTLVK